MLVCDPTDRSPQFKERPWLDEINGVETRTLGFVIAQNEIAKDIKAIARFQVPMEMLSGQFFAKCSDTRTAVEKLLTMTARVVQDAQDREVAARQALESGTQMPTSPDAETIDRIVKSQRETCTALFQEVEQVARDFVAAATTAAASRLRMRELSMESHAGTCRNFLDQFNVIQSQLRDTRVVFNEVDSAALKAACTED